MAPVARAIQKIAMRDIFRSRNFSAKPNPKGTNNKTFRKISSGPPIFVAGPNKNGEVLPGSFAWKSKRKGESVRNRIPASAAIKKRFDQLSLWAGERKAAV
jgi:hypothetical protein